MAEEKRELLLRAKDISIVFGGLKAVSDFSLDLYEGELIGLIGPNGAGKTTVFNMLSGVYKPTSGTITFLDKKGTLQVINKKTPAQLNKIGIARTFQNIRLFGAMTVLDNIKIALHQSRNVSPLDVEFRSKKFRNDEEIMKKPFTCSVFSTWKARQMNWQVTFHTVNSASWKFAVPWLPDQNCCCWTNLQPV